MTSLVHLLFNLIILIDNHFMATRNVQRQGSLKVETNLMIIFKFLYKTECCSIYLINICFFKSYNSIFLEKAKANQAFKIRQTNHDIFMLF